MSEAKPFMIQRQPVMDAYLKVKADKGGAGVEAVNMQEFDKNTKQQLYCIWNQLSSGSYLPAPVKLVVEDRSRMRRESHVRICENFSVEIPGFTR